MRATGVVRRIDELGRIVIPKEIRRTLKIKDNTPLEIFSGDSGELILKKYSPIIELGNFAEEVVNSISLATNKNVLLTNMDKVISSSSQCKAYIEKNIDSHIERLIQSRVPQIMSMKQENTLLFVENSNILLYVICPIIKNGDVFGSIILFDESNKLDECDKKIAVAFANFLGEQIG